MKLSFSTLGCPEWTFEQILDNAQKMGFGGIEIRGIEGEMDISKIPYFKSGKIPELKKELEGRNLEIVALDTSASFHDPATWNAAVKEAKDAIDTAESIGVPYIRIFGDKVPSEKSQREETLKLIAKGLNEVYRYSEKRKVTPLVESHSDFNNVEIFKELLHFMDHPKFGVLWDIEPSWQVYGNNFLEFFGFIRRYVKHTHIKDTKKIDGQWKLQNPGKGSLPIPLHTMLLEITNYDGYYSLEWEKKWVPELDEPEIAFPQYVELMHKSLF